MMVPMMTAAAVACTACLAVLIVVSTGGGNEAGPPPAPLSFSTPLAPAQQEIDSENRTLEIRVVDRQSKAPIDKVEVSVDTDSGARPGFGGEPELMTRLVTTQRREVSGRVPTRAAQGDLHHRSQTRLCDSQLRSSDRIRRPALPQTHTMELERGISIGGFVKRRDGRPISGATVIIMSRAGADASPDYSYVPYEKVTTDAEGRWIFDAMPTGWNFVYLRVTSPRLRRRRTCSTTRPSQATSSSRHARPRRFSTKELAALRSSAR